MIFKELWSQVKGLPDIAIEQVPDALSAATKKKLSRKSTEDIEKIVSAAIEEVNRGSIIPLDELIKKRL